MTEFASKIPEQEFGAAEIQLFVMEYRRSLPHMASGKCAGMGSQNQGKE
tara:strand:+ start:63 stop:209 length:147 start_codon:yes stop_codon:yes gene_type:complete